MVFAYYLVMGCSLMHIFCCGIPLLATIVSLGSTLGLLNNTISEHPFFETFEKFEVLTLIFSGLILLLAFILEAKAKKLDCCDTEAKKLCNTNDKINKIFLKTSLVLYLFSLTIFVMSAAI